MNASSILVVLLSLYSSSTLSSAQALPPTGTRCPPTAGPSCQCQPPDGDVIDLSALANTDGSPRYSNIGPDPNDYVYSYNPCSTFNGPGVTECLDIHVCQTSEDGQSSFAIASAGTEQIWRDDDGTYYVYYEGPNRATRVQLVCDQSVTDENGQLTTDGDSGVILNYVFHLTSCHACPGGCQGGGGGGGNIAGIVGIVIILVAIVALVVYFIVGAVIMKVKYQAAGSDIIPNKEFWISLPGLIKDGFLFTISPCTNAIRGRQGYEATK